MERADSQPGPEANRLYWESDISVAEIAQRLEISRRALYDAIRPVAAGGQCSSCGGELEFTNRSTRSQGFATCRDCGEQTTAELEPAWTWSPHAYTVVPTPPVPQPRNVWWLGAATLAGALAAAGVTLLVIRPER